MKYWLLAIGALLLSCSVASAQERIKIGFVDIQRVIADSQAGNGLKKDSRRR